MPVWRELVQALRGLIEAWTDGTESNRFSWFPLILEVFVLMGGVIGPLLIAFLTKEDEGALSMQVPRWIYEFLVLGLLVLFWVGWCEGGYRLGRRLGTIAKVTWQRRLTLELWTGVLFSLLLSVLTTLSTLLSLVAVFLMFAGIESLKASSPEQAPWDAVLLGFRGSFRRVSQHPLRIIILMAIPGLLLYLNSLILRICQIHFRDFLVNGNTSPFIALCMVFFGILFLLLGLLGVWLFFIARMDLAINYLRIQPNHESDLRQLEKSDRFQQLDTTLNSLRQLSRFLAKVVFAILLIVGLYELVRSDLFSRNFFYTILEACVGFVNGFVQAIVDLLTKFSFIVVVFILIIGLCLLLVSVANGEGKGSLGRFLTFLAARLQGLSNFIKEHINFSFSGLTIQVTTLVSVFGVIATQTYTKIVEAQSLRAEQQRQQEQQMKLQQQQNQNYGDLADKQIQSFQETLRPLMIKDNNSKIDWLDLDRRGQVASMTRNLLRQLVFPDGNPDGPRRARILKYLYDSRFLIENTTAQAENAKCEDALSALIKEPHKSTKNDSSPRILSTLPSFVLDQKLKDQTAAKPPCSLARLIPQGMDFSYANLKGAFLNNAALPFINLSHADLSNAQLRGADLRFANLENANLRGADLTAAKLNFGNLVNAELRKTKVDQASFKGALLFYSTRDRSAEVKMEGGLSWDLTKQKPDKDNFEILFCPLDPRVGADDKPASPIAQAGAKCNKRTYSGFRRSNDNKISNRNWAMGDFGNAFIENFRLNDIQFTNANLRGAVFRYVNFNNVSFVGANLDGARFENCALNNVDFSGASIRQMAFVDSSVERLTLRGAQYVLPIQLGDYADDLLLLSGRNMDINSTNNQSPPVRLAQNLLLPFLLAPFPLRPIRMLIWLVPYSPELLFSTPNRQSIT
jgi:uncharacterized protein YjbI with pentapeptide repeats